MIHRKQPHTPRRGKELKLSKNQQVWLSNANTGWECERNFIYKQLPFKRRL
jgi:hypothetical protein